MTFKKKEIAPKSGRIAGNKEKSKMPEDMQNPPEPEFVKAKKKKHPGKAQ